ncbi:PAS domain-containing protein, partial [Pseudomonas sp. FW306-2-11BA]
CANPANGARRKPLPAEAITATQLLDNIRDIVLLADREATILASSRSARAHFGDISTPGTPVDTITPPPSRALLGRAMQRVGSSGVGEC